MAKAYAKKFYKSKAWQQCRRAYVSMRINIDGGMCQHCRERPGYIADHIEEITPDNINDPEVTLNHKNIQYLCTICHNKKTFSKSENDFLKFDSEGQPLPP